ncbi:MAG: T9SS type A sorting domain-containing protein, partial [Chitinophagales bacterium]|nr:T9SS type A sorting domain-containing protein [Chitinophagales bacterium]
VYIQSDNAEIKSVTFFDMSGQLVLSTTADVSEGINTSSLTAGMYLIRIETNDEVINQQLIIHN